MTDDAPVEEVSNVELVPEDQAYIDGMIAKAEGRSPEAKEEPKTDGEPALLAGKFKSAADLEAAYKALEAKLGAPEVTPPANETDAPITIDQAKAAVQEAGIDFAALETEYRDGGDLSPESRAALEKKGIGKDVVDSFLAGQKAAETLGRQKVFETVGGEAQYRSMIAWAQGNLEADEIEAFNAVALGSNFAALRMAAAGLYARYEAQEGKEPKLVSGNIRESADTYQSWAQVRVDMGNPLYDKDDAFRSRVEQKLGRSSI